MDYREFEKRIREIDNHRMDGLIQIATGLFGTLVAEVSDDPVLTQYQTVWAKIKMVGRLLAPELKKMEKQ